MSYNVAPRLAGPTKTPQPDILGPFTFEDGTVQGMLNDNSGNPLDLKWQTSGVAPTFAVNDNCIGQTSGATGKCSKISGATVVYFQSGTITGTFLAGETVQKVGDATKTVILSATVPSLQWIIDPGVAADGFNSARLDVPINAANQQYDCNAQPLFTATPSAFVRFAYMQSSTFDNASPIKVLRVSTGIGGTQVGTIMHNKSGANQLARIDDDVGGSGLSVNVNGPGPTPNSLRGSWHWFEFYVNIVDATHTDYRMWIDGVQYFEYPGHVNATRGATSTFRSFFIGGIFNVITVAGSVWYDQLSVASFYQGVP